MGHGGAGGWRATRLWSQAHPLGDADSGHDDGGTLIRSGRPAVAVHLHQLDHDALAVAVAGLAETDDAVIYAAAVEQDRVVVTENFADFSVVVPQHFAGDEPCVPVLFIKKRYLPRGGALAPHLADHLHRWATANPDTYPGPHWP